MRVIFRGTPSQLQLCVTESCRRTGQCTTQSHETGHLGTQTQTDRRAVALVVAWLCWHRAASLHWAVARMSLSMSRVEAVTTICTHPSEGKQNLAALCGDAETVLLIPREKLTTRLLPCAMPIRWVQPRDPPSLGNSHSSRKRNFGRRRASNIQLRP